MKGWHGVLSVVYLAALLILWGIIHSDQGESWWVTLFLFSPRWVVALPLLIFVPLSLWKRRAWIGLHVVSATVIAFPIMGFTWNTRPAHDSVDPTVFRLLSCNLGNGDTNLPKLIALAKFYRIDAILLQECPTTLSGPLFEELGWNHLQEANMAFGSPHGLSDLRLLARQPVDAYNAIATVACDLEWIPDEASGSRAIKVQLVNVHFPTFRPAFEKARRFDGRAAEAFKLLKERYHQLVSRAKTSATQWADQHDRPTVIAGDFNVPVESVFYRQHWQKHSNALSVAGRGFNATKFTRLHGVRIDHVLVDPDWRVLSAWVGPNLGGDHNPVLAEFQCVAF